MHCWRYVKYLLTSRRSFLLRTRNDSSSKKSSEDHMTSQQNTSVSSTYTDDDADIMIDVTDTDDVDVCSSRSNSPYSEVKPPPFLPQTSPEPSRPPPQTLTSRLPTSSDVTCHARYWSMRAPLPVFPGSPAVTAAMLWPTFYAARPPLLDIAALHAFVTPSSADYLSPFNNQLFHVRSPQPSCDVSYDVLPPSSPFVDPIGGDD